MASVLKINYQHIFFNIFVMESTAKRYATRITQLTFKLRSMYTFHGRINSFNWVSLFKRPLQIFIWWLFAFLNIIHIYIALTFYKIMPCCTLILNSMCHNLYYIKSYKMEKTTEARKYMSQLITSDEFM